MAHFQASIDFYQQSSKNPSKDPSKDPTFVVFIGFMGVAGRFFVRMTQTALDLEDFVLRQRILSDWK